MTGRRKTDWLRDSAQPGPQGEPEGAGERRTAERRGGDRRAPRRPIDPRFAATLINQVLPESETIVAGYADAEPAPRAGIVVNVRA